MKTGVYLLHLNPPYKGASHYIGWSNDIDSRYQRHLSGDGSPLVKAAIDEGCEVTIARIWEGKSRNFERKLKNRKKAHRLCPFCHKNWNKNAK